MQEALRGCCNKRLGDRKRAGRANQLTCVQKRRRPLGPNQAEVHSDLAPWHVLARIASSARVLLALRYTGRKIYI